jgi:MFS family permease
VSKRGLILGHPDFRRLWLGETVSEFGTQISVLAMPLTAVATLHASTFQVALLTALQTAAFLLIGLPAGAWVDRMRRRPVLIGADIVRALLLASVPVAAVLHVLTLGQLYLVVFVTGLATVFFDVAYQSYLPLLVGREHLIEGNGRLEASHSVARTGGPTIAGYLVQAVTAPVALLADATSFLWSAAWIGRIRHREPVPARAARPALRQEIGAGLRVVLDHPVLRAIASYGATVVLFMSLERAIEVVFLLRTLRLSASGIGVLYSLSSIGSVLGAFAAAPLTRRVGQARMILLSALGANASMLLIPLSGRGAGLAFYAVGSGAASFCIVVSNIVSVSFRQALIPDHLLGRVNATMRFLLWGTLPVGGLIGGALGTAIGLRATLWVAAVGGVLSVLWLVASPLRRGRDLPVPDAGKLPEPVR